MIAHHLDEATLLRYASGNLDEAYLVVVASHLAMCETCRKAVHEAEELGGELLEHADAPALGPASFERLMKRLDGIDIGEETDRPAFAAPHAATDVPLPLRRFIGDRLADVRWRTIAPGVKKHVIAQDPNSSSLYMLQVASGKAVPEHGHGGGELTLILSGAYRDEFGVFGPGDIADLDEHVVHKPHVEEGAPCICLVAAETRIRFRGIISRLMQPFAGI